MAKFKKGDKVRAVNASNGWGNVEYGDIGLVTGIDTDGDYLVDFDRQSGWAAKKGDLALLVDKPTKNQRIKTLEQNVVSLEQQVAELQAEVAALKKAKSTPKFVPVTTYNIAVGDKVRVVDSSEIGPAELTDGTVYEVVKVNKHGNFYVIDDESYQMSICSSEFHAIEKVVYE